MDARLNAFRDDLADARLRGQVVAGRFVDGDPGRVAIGRAPVRRLPAPDAPLDTFFHHGEEVLVFERREGWAWCQSQCDHYVGYVAESALAIGESPRPTHYVATTGSYRYVAPDLRSEILDYLPRHSAVVVAEAGLMTRGTEYARLDTGGCLPIKCLSDEPARSPDLVSAAELYLGCPYLWGGRDFLGLDCSALVQNAFADLGIAVLRDTDMQRDTIGSAVSAVSIEELQPGDLVYMPGHVMTHAGEGTMIHADGATMTVRREPLTTFMQRTGLDFASFTVRRP